MTDPSLSQRQRAAASRLVSFGIAVLVVSTLLVGLAGHALYREFSRAADLRTAMRQSYETRSQIQQVFSLMQDAETGQRGFVITGREAYLAPYDHAMERVDDQLQSLGTLLRTNPDMFADYQRLVILVERKRRTLEHGIASRREGGAQAGASVVSSGAGKAAMDDIRTVIERLTQREAAAVNQAAARADEQTKVTERLVVALFASLILLAWGASLLVWRYLRTREVLMRQAETSAARQRAIFDSAIDAVITLNPSGSIETANPAAERMFGYSGADLARRDISLLIDVAEGREGSFLERLDADGSALKEARGRRRDGHEFPVDVAVGPMDLPTGRHIVAIVRDISERRRIEKMKDEFVSTVSHELRTPLTSIAGSLGLLEGGAAGALPEKAARLISIANANSQRLVRLINDILDVEKLQSGQMKLNMAALDLRDVAQRSIDGARGYADKLGVRFELQAAEPVSIFGDDDRLVQVVTNLLSNAAKFSPMNGEVTVTLAVVGRAARLSVADKGPGVPEDFRDRIFEKFAQADSSDRRAKGGTGLGLAIARELTERHGGKLWLESIEGDGATFHMELPLDRKGAASTKDGRQRVLVCEDDPAVAGILAEMLDHEGLAADIAATAREGLALARANEYVAVLVDLHLPDAHGVSLIRALKAGDDTKALPVVVVSGDIAAGKAKARSLSVADWMEKPFDQARLQRALEVVREKGDRLLILHVDDDRDLLAVVHAALSGSAEIAPAQSLAAARAFLASNRPDLVILDLGLPDGSGLELLPDLSQPGEPSIPVVVYSAQDTDAAANAAVEAVLTKSRMSLNQLADTVRRLGAPKTSYS